MRVSTSWTYQTAVYTMQNLQSSLSQSQSKLASGQKYLSPSENPAASVSLINFTQNIQITQQYQTNINAAKDKLQLADSTLNSAVNVLQSIQSLAMQSLNGINTPLNQQEIATQVDQLNQQLMNLANTQDASGDYIFSGTNTTTLPYTSTPNPNAPSADAQSTDPLGFTYNGNSSQASITIGPENRQVANGNPGDAVFGTLSSGPLTTGSISNVFQAVSQLANNLNNNTSTSASLTDITNALTRMETVQASVGARLQATNSQQNINAQTILDNQTTASSIGDLDYASAISQLDLQQTALQAAEQSFTKVQGLSLFQYIQ
ncbi:flagellar hook-associated protein FlgL [Methylomonas sp. AM2-LC]|uniref:flagellar hook-associated protein FlgL n=1 Tax=Methylomonas sp. AM2-LC TaxID=3153301 RepID=UPI00326487AD